MNQKEKEYLLNLARTAIKNLELSDDIPVSEALREKRAVFVTLTKNNDLRGCIGHLIPLMPCYQAVIECAKSAAYEDTRFLPVSEDEIDELSIEISVLSLPIKMQYTDSFDILKKLSPGKDGVILKKGMHQATFLPQVWEQIPDKKQFLSHLCLKAGLDLNEWKKGKIEIETYQVESFHD